MKNLAYLRAKALNASLIAYIISFAICLILYFSGKKLTTSEYTFPFDYEKGVYHFVTIPGINNWWLMLIVPLFVFGIRHMLLVYKEFKDPFLKDIPIVCIVATIAGFIGGACLSSLIGSLFWATLVGVFFSSILLFFEKNWSEVILGNMSATIWSTISIFSFCLFRTSLGLGEALAITIGCSILFSIFNTIINSLLYICMAIVERIITVCKTAKWLGHTEAVKPQE